MEHRRENGVLTVFLPERVDGMNSDKVKQEIEGICDAEPFERLIFDCGKLSYISSAGLRVILI